MATTPSDLLALEREVRELLAELPTCGSNAEQLTRFQRVQELVLHRDPTGDAHALLLAAAPFLAPLAQLQNAALVAALLQLLAQAARRNAQFLRELYETINALLMLSFSTEKNVLSAIQLALTSLPQAFLHALSASAPDEHRTALWAAVTLSLEHMVEVVATTPLLPIGSADTNNNRSALVWLRAWKYLECAALVLSPAQDAAMYRDPARSNVQPDAVTLDRVAPNHPVLDRAALETLGREIVQILCDRIGRSIESSSAMLQVLGRREVCVALNSLALLAALRPSAMRAVLTALVAFQSENLPGSADAVVQATLRANLVKLLSHPSAQASADEVTECLISLGASERAFRAISKSKEPRRRYVSAPSEASLRKARIGKRAAQSIAEKVENDTSKRHRIGDASSSASRSAISAMTAATRSRADAAPVTHETIVDMASSTVVNLVLESFTSALPTPAPPQLKLELTPSELKSRMTALLNKLATPSSAHALEASAKRVRDPRRRRDPLAEAPALVQIFDSDGVDEVSDWVSKNASAIAEPLVSVAEDNTVHVYLKPATPTWCREMAVAALARILESEDGVRIRGDDALRERVLCRLASSPWLLLTDAANAPLDLTRSDAPLPSVYRSVLDFVLDDVAARASLAVALLFHEYTRFTRAQVGVRGSCSVNAADGSDIVYRKAVAYLFEALVSKLDLAAAVDKKLFGALVSQLPRVTTELLRVVVSLFGDTTSSGSAVLAITVLRDLVKDRAACSTPALQILLRYTADANDSTRNSAIRCVANQLYSVETLRDTVEQFAIRLVQSLHDDNEQQQTVAKVTAPAATTAAAAKVDSSSNADVEMEAATAPSSLSTPDTHRSQWLRDRVRALTTQLDPAAQELLTFAAECESELALTTALDTESEALRRLELHLALCAKKPALLKHVIVAYAHARESVRQTIFHAIEKLIKHLKQRGGVNVVAQLDGFDARALTLVCHIIQILSVRPAARTADESAAAAADLVHDVLTLFHASPHVPDAVSVLIPILPSMRAHVLFPLLPALLSLPPPRLAVAITRLLEAMPPQVVAPIDLLVALHHIDLKREPTMQKKVIAAINLCVEHRHAFPSDVLLHVCRVLVHDERVSRLALRTLILSVTAYPTLQPGVAALLDVLVARRVWAMDDDALWKGFVKCAALVQPASFPLLLTRLPLPQLRAVVDDAPELRALLQQFVATPEAAATLRLSPDVHALLATTKDEPVATADSNSEVTRADAAPAIKTESCAVKLEPESPALATPIEQQFAVKIEADDDQVMTSSDQVMTSSDQVMTSDDAPLEQRP